MEVEEERNGRGRCKDVIPKPSAEVRPTALALRQVHTESAGHGCTSKAGRIALGCWCERCKDLRPYVIGRGQDWGPAA
jgi:hypothetical protein